MTYRLAAAALVGLGALALESCLRAEPLPTLEPVALPAFTLLPDTAQAEPLPAMPIVAPADVGMAASGLTRIDQRIWQAIADSATPGAALAIGRNGKLVRSRGYGRTDWREGFPEVTDSTIYDLASLTKVVGTTTAAMILVEEGVLDLDAPVADYLPDFQGKWKELATVRQLLTHTAGFPPGATVWSGAGREEVIRRIVAAPLTHPPGSRTVYSDYDVIVLGAIIERISGQTLEVLLQERVFAPLQMRDTGFNPRNWWFTRATPHAPIGLRIAPSAMSRIAPTEFDRTYRLRHLHGDVHDPTAFSMAGVSAHAGLFSSARDLAVFAQMLLNGGVYGSVRLLSAQTIREFTRRQSPESSRALGWDTPTGTSSAGEHFSAASFGHTGYTGTSLWIDPARDLFVVLLTNRINPSAANRRHVPLRRDVHDLAQRAILDPAVGAAPGVRTRLSD